MKQAIESLLYAALLGAKRQAALFSEEEEIRLIRLCQNYLIAGFVLKSNSLDPTNRVLLNSLRAQRKIASLKLMSMKQNLIEIAEKFNEQNIDFVVLKGLALAMRDIYKPGVRAVRDIDLLVSTENIPRAYKALRTLRFKYIDPDTADQATIFGHYHFPVMTNHEGTFIELHWRVTKIDSFKNCPLTETIIAQRQECSTHEGIYVPNIAGMMAHTLYHGLIHHRMTHGPLFLFDLAALYKNNQNMWPRDNTLIEKLGLIDAFEQCKRLIEITASEDDFSPQSMALINKISKNFDWPIRKPDKVFSLFGVSQKRLSIADLLIKLKNRTKATSSMYQLTFKSPRYWFLFFRDLWRAVKKFRF